MMQFESKSAGGSRNRVAALGVGVLIVLLVGPGLTATVNTATWINSGTGNWSDSANWNINDTTPPTAGVPANSGSDTYEVSIPLGTASFQTFAQDVTINSLSVSGPLSGAPTLNANSASLSTGLSILNGLSVGTDSTTGTFGLVNQGINFSISGNLQMGAASPAADQGSTVQYNLTNGNMVVLGNIVVYESDITSTRAFSHTGGNVIVGTSLNNANLVLGAGLGDSTATYTMSAGTGADPTLTVHGDLVIGRDSSSGATFTQNVGTVTVSDTLIINPLGPAPWNVMKADYHMTGGTLTTADMFAPHTVRGDAGPTYSFVQTGGIATVTGTLRGLYDDVLGAVIAAAWLRIHGAGAHFDLEGNARDATLMIENSALATINGNLYTDLNPDGSVLHGAGLVIQSEATGQFGEKDIFAQHLENEGRILKPSAETGVTTIHVPMWILPNSNSNTATMEINGGILDLANGVDPCYATSQTPVLRKIGAGELQVHQRWKTPEILSVPSILQNEVGTTTVLCLTDHLTVDARGGTVTFARPGAGDINHSLDGLMISGGAVVNANSGTIDLNNNAIGSDFVIGAGGGTLNHANNALTIGNSGNTTWGNATLFVAGSPGGKVEFHRIGGTILVGNSAVMTINSGAAVNVLVDGSGGVNPFVGLDPVDSGTRYVTIYNDSLGNGNGGFNVVNNSNNVTLNVLSTTTHDASVGVTSVGSGGTLTINNSLLQQSIRDDGTLAFANNSLGTTNNIRGTVQNVPSAGTLDVRNSAVMTFNANGGSGVSAGTDANYSRLGALTLAGTTDNWNSTLDVNDNKVILDNSNSATAAATYTQVNNQIKQAANFDTVLVEYRWDGTGGITSSKARDQELLDDNAVTLGVVNNDYGDGVTPAFYGPMAGLYVADTFAGQTVAATSVLTRYTWWGDANLSGVVDVSDFNLFQTGFNDETGTLIGWEFGDFNYDGVVDINDFNIFQTGFNLQTGPLSARGGATPVPEPASAALLVAAGILLAIGRSGHAFDKPSSGHLYRKLQEVHNV